MLGLYGRGRFKVKDLVRLEVQIRATLLVYIRSTDE